MGNDCSSIFPGYPFLVLQNKKCTGPTVRSGRKYPLAAIGEPVRLNIPKKKVRPVPGLVFAMK